MNNAFLPAGRIHAPARFKLGKIAPLGAIVLLHAGLLYGLRSGPQQQAMPPAPREIVATFVMPAVAPAPIAAPPLASPPAPAPEPLKAQPAPKKTMSAPRKAITPSVQPTPMADTTPTRQETAPLAESALPVAAAPAPPAPAPMPAQPKTVTSGIEYLRHPQPEYPPLATRMGEEGKAVLRVLVNDQGRPERIEVQKSSGSARLDNAARQAVSRALFKPFIEDGKPVSAYAIIPINFQLDS